MARRCMQTFVEMVIEVKLDSVDENVEVEAEVKEIKEQEMIKVT